MNKKYLIVSSLLFLLSSCNSTKESTVVQAPIAQAPDTEKPLPQASPTLSPEEIHQKLVTEKPVTEWVATSAQPSNTNRANTEPVLTTSRANTEPVLTTSRANTDKQKIDELSRKLNLINAKYTDLNEAAEQEYLRSKIKNSDLYTSGKLTNGQLEYQESMDKIAKLEKQSKYNEALIQESEALIKSTVDVKALYKKYNIPSDAGAATLGAIANQL